MNDDELWKIFEEKLDGPINEIWDMLPAEERRNMLKLMHEWIDCTF